MVIHGYNPGVLRPELRRVGIKLGSRPAQVTYKYSVLKRKNKFSSLPSGAGDLPFVSPIAFSWHHDWWSNVRRNLEKGSVDLRMLLFNNIEQWIEKQKQNEALHSLPTVVGSIMHWRAGGDRDIKLSPFCPSTLFFFIQNQGSDHKTEMHLLNEFCRNVGETVLESLTIFKWEINDFSTFVTFLWPAFHSACLPKLNEEQTITVSLLFRDRPLRRCKWMCSPVSKRERHGQVRLPRWVPAVWRQKGLRR